MFTEASEFSRQLSRVLISSLGNDHDDNFDFDRFQSPEREIVKREENFSFVCSNMPAFSEVYDLLHNDESKDLYVLLTAFKILGHRKVRLPLSHADYWDLREKLNRLVTSSAQSIDAGLFDWKLYLTDLRFIGVPITQYASGGGILIDFILKQYEYHRDEIHIAAKPGDIIIDAGACWGDTALYFSHIAGPTGKVYSFDFTENIAIFKKNITLNPLLASQITLIEKAVWKNSHDLLFFNEGGPGTKVSAHHKDETKPVQSIAIDDLVREEKLERIDFIKMDIEGAEQAAIEGAVETLKRFRPQLAITIYHNDLEDCIEVPRMLSALDLGYKFFIGHFTAFTEETVLFAIT
jgi:FkbM family methyltransferase